MKNIIIFLIACIGLSSCKSCTSNYALRKQGVKTICPTCDYVRSENLDIAIDTASQPNQIFIVSFKGGGVYYNAWDVDHLRKVY